MRVCTICNRTYPDDAKVCEHDGQKLIRVSRLAATDAGPAIDWDGPMAGDIVGNYRLESLIAEGGMGRIFKATHLRLDRPVALKFLLPEHASRADLVRRFFNEARSVNAIRHPHIIDIIDFVEEVDEEGRALVYMVMEFLEGEDTRKRLRRDGPYPPELVAHVGAQVAETLAAAHDAGVLHRDLKPDNIFLCKSGKRDDFVKLLDFGAAKSFGDRPGHHLTRPGVAIGTPEYMSPEQITNRPMDGRLDAYGLGCVCYELCTGSVPFRAENVAGILAKHTGERPIPPSRRRKVPPPVPPSLERVILRCMEKDPDDRYPDLWAVAEAFQAVIAKLRSGETETPAPRADEPLPDRGNLTPLELARQAAAELQHDDDEPLVPFQPDEQTRDFLGPDSFGGDAFDDTTRRSPVASASSEATLAERGEPRHRLLTGPPTKSSELAARGAPPAAHSELLAAAEHTGAADALDDDEWEPQPVRRKRGNVGMWIVLIALLAAGAGLAVVFLLR
ncbi:MAG: serine/threonine protein kinase [Myxococcales bacterium]|nr:serine/threonine protein kinase [Myxococcales bacterium]